MSGKFPANIPTIEIRRCQRCDTLAGHGMRTSRGKRKPQPYCKRCMVEYHAEWRAGKGREKFAAADRASKEQYPERRRARGQLAHALRTGRIIKGDCYAAGSDCSGKIEAHHDDYSRPLDVVWTCRTHHRALDEQRRERAAWYADRWARVEAWEAA